MNVKLMTTEELLALKSNLEEEFRVLFPDEFKEPEPILTDDTGQEDDVDAVEPEPEANEGDDAELPPAAMEALREMLNTLSELLATSEDEDEQFTDEDEEV